MARENAASQCLKSEALFELQRHHCAVCHAPASRAHGYDKAPYHQPSTRHVLFSCGFEGRLDDKARIIAASPQPAIPSIQWKTAAEEKKCQPVLLLTTCIAFHHSLPTLQLKHLYMPPSADAVVHARSFLSPSYAYPGPLRERRTRPQYLRLGRSCLASWLMSHPESATTFFIPRCNP